MVLAPCLLAIGINWSFADPPLSREHRVQQNYEQQDSGSQAAEQPAENSDPRVVQSPAAAPTDPRPNPHGGRAAEDSDSHTNDGLLWGDGMAQWAMALTGIAALAVSIGGIFLLVATLNATREAVRASNLTAKAAIAAERPYIFLWKTAKDKQGNCLGVTFKNFGRTPAFVERLKIEVRTSEFPPVPDKDATGGRVLHRTAIATHNESWPSNWHYPVVFDYDPTCENKTYVFGAIVYHDPIDRIHRHWFCYVYDGRNFVPDHLNHPDLNGYDGPDLNGLSTHSLKRKRWWRS